MTKVDTSLAGIAGFLLALGVDRISGDVIVGGIFIGAAVLLILVKAYLNAKGIPVEKPPVDSGSAGV